MASNTKGDLKKALAARNLKVQVDSLKFEIKQRDQKIEKLRLKISNLKAENEKLKALIPSSEA